MAAFLTASGGLLLGANGGFATTAAVGGGGGDPTALWNVDIVEGATTARTNQPFSFGLPLGPGQFDSATQKIVVYDGETALADAQYTCECVDQDGDGRWVRVDGIIPSLSSGGTKTLSVKAESGSQSAGTPITAADLQTFINANATGNDVRVAMVIGGTTYTASVKAMLDATKTTYSAAEPHYRGAFFAGPMASCYVGSVPLEDGSGNRASDYLRVDFHAYGWKTGGAIVGAKIDAIVWNSAFNPVGGWSDVAWSALRVEDGSGGVVEGYTSTSSTANDPNRGVAYGHSRFMFDPVWVGLSSAEKGSWEALHETTSGKLQKAIDAKWLIDTYNTSAIVSSQIGTWKTGLDGNGINPFRSKGNHVLYNQGSTGPRYEIGYLTQGQNYAVAAWSSSDARHVVRQNARESLHIPWFYVDHETGVLLDIVAKPSESIFTETKPTKVGGGTPWAIDAGHHPCDHILTAMLDGDFWCVQALQAVAHGIWTQINFGTGYNKRLATGLQDRGAAWAMRSVGAALALTPNAQPAGLTGMSRANLQGWLDATCGIAGDVITFGSYHGAKNQCWGTPTPASGAFDNTVSPPDCFRWVPQDGHNNGAGQNPMRIWGAAYYATALSWMNRLKVGNADFNSYFAWMNDFFEQFLQDPRWALVSAMYGRLGMPTDVSTYPMSVDAVLSEMARTLTQENNKTGGPPDSNLFVTGSHDFGLLGITGVTFTYSAMNAVTVHLEGASAIDYFTDPSSTWFTAGLGAVVAIPNQGVAIASWPDYAAGHITSVVNGKTVVVDFQTRATVNGSTDWANEIDPAQVPSGTTLTPDEVRLPAPDKTASWLATHGNLLIGVWSNEYPPAVLGAIEALAGEGINTDVIADRRAKLRGLLVEKGRIADAVNFPTVGDGNIDFFFKGAA